MINQLGGAASPVQHLDKGNRAQASSRTIFLLSCLLILAVFAVYHQAASHPYFNLDDRVYVVDNVHVSAGLRWSLHTICAATNLVALLARFRALRTGIDVQTSSDNATGHSAALGLLAIGADVSS